MLGGPRSRSRREARTRERRQSPAERKASKRLTSTRRIEKCFRTAATRTFSTLSTLLRHSEFLLPGRVGTPFHDRDGGFCAGPGVKIPSTLMIADNGLWRRNWPADPIGGRGACTADMRCKRRDLNVGQQSLIRGSGRMTLFRLGLPLSRWRASRLIVVTRAPRHCPASSTAYRAEADVWVLRSPLLAVCQIAVTPPLARIEPCRRSTR